MRLLRVGFVPVKGTRHPALEAAELAASGPVGDRVFCLVDLERGAVLRTVQNPRLMQLEAGWTDPVLSLRLPDGGLVEDEPAPDGRVVELDYWGRRPRLAIQRSVVADAASQFLGRRVALARVVGRSDVVYGDPVTLVTASELASLGERTGVERLVEESARFRATLTVDDTDDPGAVVTGARLRVGGAVVEVTAEVPRCAVIDRDPSTGAKAGDLLAALASYRRRDGEVWFGHQARVVAPGLVRPGDTVQRVPSRASASRPWSSRSVIRRG